MTEQKSQDNALFCASIAGGILFVSRGSGLYAVGGRGFLYNILKKHEKIICENFTDEKCGRCMSTMRGVGQRRGDGRPRPTGECLLAEAPQGSCRSHAAPVGATVLHKPSLFRHRPSMATETSRSDRSWGKFMLPESYEASSGGMAASNPSTSCFPGSFFLLCMRVRALA